MGNNDSLFSQYLADVRDRKTQVDPLRFRRNMERIGAMFAYEISRRMNYRSIKITTPLGRANERMLAEQPVVGAILRAGLGLHSGMVDFFDRADSCFVSAYRKHDRQGNFTIHVEYMSAPSMEGRILILCDPMLATGQSMVLSHRALLEKGTPRFTHFVTVVGSEQGVKYLHKNVKSPAMLWIVAIDPRLDRRAYIVPGLGDAGDLAYGKKE